MNEVDKFNEQHHGKSEAEREQIIYGGDWRPQDMMKPEEQLRQCSRNDPAFSSQLPYPVDAHDFYEADDRGFPKDVTRFTSMMDAVAEEAAEMGVEIDFDGIVLE